MKINLGSDLIECLSWSLYENPIVLFREAIQNSIDAFSELQENWPKLQINLNLDQSKREISIKDNGPGLGDQDFNKILGTLGASRKKQRNLAGCRGIGRLSGLGICDEIIISSKIKGSEFENQCFIDAKGIKNKLKENNQDSDLAEFLSEFIKFSKNKCADNSQSYFTVNYKNIIRLSGDYLLNPQTVEKYVCDIAPIPISGTSPIIKNIENLYKKFMLPYGIAISINENNNIIKKFDEKMFGSENKNLQFESYEISSESSQVLGVAWFIHHDYLGALSSSPFRGLRFRHKNILIGCEDTFSNLFKEQRFNRWTVGEVHSLDPSIRPSVKRDDFEPNASFNALAYKLKPHLFKVVQLARKSSVKRVEEKSLARILEQKPLLKKIQKRLQAKLPKSISKKQAIEIAEDIFMASKGKLSPDLICGAFLTNKISI